jgi:starch phosphorylase
VALYNAMRADPGAGWVPVTKIFAGKAAPSYQMAKLIIKLINDVAAVVNHDPAVAHLLKIVFLPNYSVTSAELIIPAADLSQQISTAGLEASGTGNMKLALNGALTIGTLDGANVEIREAVGPDNIFIFGLTAEEVEALHRSRSYNPREGIGNSPALARALEMIGTGAFSPDDRARYHPLLRTLVEGGDYFLVTADFEAYCRTYDDVFALYRDPEAWSAKAVLNTASMGWFSSDRTVGEYAREIWNVVPAVTGPGV